MVDSCNLAVSANETLILTWWQVRSAIDRLMSTCVMHPGPGKGGKAYLEGSQPILSTGGVSKPMNTTGRPNNLKYSRL